MKEDYNHIYDSCKNHMHAYVLAEMVDGTKVDGIITGLDDENVYFALPMDQDEAPFERGDDSNQRQFGGWYGGGYGYPGYGYGYPGWYPRPRFRRLVLPLAALAAISLLPWY